MRIPRPVSAALLALPFALPLALPLAAQPGPPRRAAPGEQVWAPPLGSPLRVSESYSLPDGPYRSGHRGVDMPAVPGREVRSPVAGTVSFAGTVVDRPVLSIRVDARTVVSLEPVASPLREGDAVGRGDPVGEIARGGHCDGGCLHLGTRIDGEYVNPLRFLRPRPVLLPW